MKAHPQEDEAKFSRLLDTALAGDTMVINEAGRPVERLKAVAMMDREPGAAAGKARLTEAFFEPLPAAVLTDFESDLT